MPRKWCLNTTFLVSQLMVLVYSEETCMWCDKDIREKFTDCWHNKIVENPTFTNMSISGLDDIKSRLITIPEPIQERLDEVINKALEDEITRLLHSVAKSSVQSMQEVIEAMMNDIRNCYVEVTGNTQVYLIYSIRDLIDLIMNKHQPEDMAYISEQKGNSQLEQHLSHQGNEYNLDASGNVTSTYPPKERSTLSDTDSMDKKNSDSFQTPEVSISSYELSNNSNEKVPTDYMSTDEIQKAKKFSETLFVALLKSNLFRETFVRTISKVRAQYLAFKMAFHAITNYGYSEYAKETAYACAASIKLLPKNSAPQAFGGKISKAITSIFYQKGLIQENTREQAQYLASEMLNYLSNIISVQLDSDSLILNLTRQSSRSIDDKQGDKHANEAYTKIVIKGKESRNKDSQRNYETSGTAAGKLFYAALLNLLQSSPYVSYIFNENISNLKERSLAVFLIRNALQNDYGDEIANESATACENTLSKRSSRSKASALLKDIVNCLTVMLDKYDIISTDKAFQQATNIGHKINKSLQDMLKNTPAFQLDKKNRKFTNSLFTDGKGKNEKIQKPKIAYNYIKNKEASVYANLSNETENNEKSNRTDYFPIYKTSLLKYSTQGFANNLQQSSTESSIEQKQPDLQTQKVQQIVKIPHSINYPDDYYSDYYYSNHLYHESDEMASNNDEQVHQYTSTNSSNTESTVMKSNLQKQEGKKTVPKSQIINDKQYNYPKNNYLYYFNDYYLNYGFSNEEYYSKGNYLDDYYFNYYNPFYDYYYPHYPESEEIISYNNKQQPLYTNTNRSNSESTELKSNLQTQGGQKTFQKFRIISDKQYSYPQNDYLNNFNDYYLNYDLSNEDYNPKANYLNDYYSNYYNPFYDYYYYHPHYPAYEEIISYNGRQQHPYTDMDHSNTESSEVKQQSSLQRQEQQNFQNPYIFNDIHYNYPDHDYYNYYYFTKYRAKYDYSYSDFKNYYFSNYYNYPEVYQSGYNFYADNYDTTYNEDYLNQDHNLDHSDNKPEGPKTLQLNLQQQQPSTKSKQFLDKSENPEPWAAADDYSSNDFIYDFYNENYEIPSQNDEHLYQYKNIDYPDIGLGLPENLQFILQQLGGFNKNEFSIQYENPVPRPATDYYYFDDYKTSPYNNMQLYNFINNARWLKNLESSSTLQQKNLDHILAYEYYPYYYSYDYNSNYYDSEGFQKLHDEEKLQYGDVNRLTKPEDQHITLQSQKENSEYNKKNLNSVEFFKKIIYLNTPGKENNYKNDTYATTVTNDGAENNYKFYRIGRKTNAQNEISSVKSEKKQIPFLPITQKKGPGLTRFDTSKKSGKVRFLQIENNDITKNQDTVIPNLLTDIFPADKPKENSKYINQITNERKLGNTFPELSSNSKPEYRMKMLMDTAKASATGEKFDYKSLASVMSLVAIAMKHEHPDWDSGTIIKNLLIETLVACIQLLVHNNEKISMN
ncbi:hypothetical protein X975_24017, partial [Stegodyphus mimosarum]